MRIDYYELLGVRPDADRTTIKASYRKLAMRLHPDHNDGDPAAVERFKQVAEAWHTLSDAERRADYDSWLERHKKYDHLPELAQMPRHRARMSSRNAERRSNRHGLKSAGRVRPFLLRRGTRVSAWQYVLMCGLCLCCILPGIARAVRGISHDIEQTTQSKLEPGESPLSPEEQEKSLRQYLQRISHAAQSGDPASQFAYANLLYNGIAGLEMAPDPQNAFIWWRKAADQGYRPAQRALKAMPVPHPSSPGAVEMQDVDAY